MRALRRFTNLCLTHRKQITCCFPSYFKAKIEQKSGQFPFQLELRQKCFPISAKIAKMAPQQRRRLAAHLNRYDLLGAETRDTEGAAASYAQPEGGVKPCCAGKVNYFAIVAALGAVGAVTAFLRQAAISNINAKRRKRSSFTKSPLDGDSFVDTAGLLFKAGNNAIYNFICIRDSGAICGRKLKVLISKLRVTFISIFRWELSQFPNFWSLANFRS